MKLDDAVEEVLADPAELTIDSSQSTLDEGPVLGVVVRNLNVSVVEVSNGNYNSLVSNQLPSTRSELTQPVVNPHVRLNVQKQGVAGSNNAREHVKRTEGREKTKVGEQDERTLALAEDTAARVEVALADAGRRALKTVATSRDVPDEVAHPSENLVNNQSEKLVGRGVLKKFQHGVRLLLLLLLVVLAGGGDKDHVLLHVAGVLVVAVVREFPGEVRDHESRVSKEADNVIQPLVLGEGAMTSLVAENPETSADEALDEPVGDPSHRPD